MSEGGQPSVAGPRATAPIRNSHDFYGGVTLVVLAAIALALSLLVRNTTMFGPVMMPRLFAILVVLGRRGRGNRPDDDPRAPGFLWRRGAGRARRGRDAGIE